MLGSVNICRTDRIHFEILFWTVIIQEKVFVNISNVSMALYQIKRLVLSDLWSSWFCSEKFLPKQPFTDVLQNRCSWKFHKILWWTLTLESLFNKVAGLQQVTDLQAYDFIKTRLHPKCFLVNFVKYLRMSFLQNTTRRLLLSLSTECLINSFDSRLHIRLWNPSKTLFTKNFSTQGFFNKCDHIRSVLGI